MEAYLLCPKCKWPFRWDGVGSGDICPTAFCKTYVKGVDSLITKEEYYKAQNLKFAEMQTGGKYNLSGFDYIHRNCGGVVVFTADMHTWKCPKCKLQSSLDAILEKRPKTTEVNP